MLDLESIFSEPVTEVITTTTGELMTTTAGEMDTVAEEGTLAESKFDGWARRTDVAGQIGCERPGLPEPECWWAHCTFGQLPELPPACDECGNLELWETLAGDWRCLHCDPPTTAIKVLEQAERIRRRHGIPSPAAAAEMLADLRMLTAMG